MKKTALLIVGIASIAALISSCTQTSTDVNTSAKKCSTKKIYFKGGWALKTELCGNKTNGMAKCTWHLTKGEKKVSPTCGEVLEKSKRTLNFTTTNGESKAISIAVDLCKKPPVLTCH